MRSLLGADRRRDRLRHVWRSGGWSAGFAVAFVLIFAVAVLTPAGQYTDAFGLAVFDWIPLWAHVALSAVRHIAPLAVGTMAVILGIVGLGQRRVRDVMAGLCGIAVAYAASSILKYVVLERPFYGDFGYTFNTYPSGHVAVSVMASIMIVRILPGNRARPVVASCLTAVVTVVGIASVTTVAHRPSDVLGGIVLAGMLAPWATRMHLPSLRRLRQRAHGPLGAVAAIIVAITALAPLSGAYAGTAVFFISATLGGTGLVVWVASEEQSG